MSRGERVLGFDRRPLRAPERTDRPEDQRHKQILEVRARAHSSKWVRGLYRPSPALGRPMAASQAVWLCTSFRKTPGACNGGSSPVRSQIVTLAFAAHGLAMAAFGLIKAETAAGRILVYRRGVSLAATRSFDCRFAKGTAKPQVGSQSRAKEMSHERP